MQSLLDAAAAKGSRRRWWSAMRFPTPTIWGPSSAPPSAPEPTGSSSPAPQRGLTAIVAKTSAGAVSYMPVARVANIPSLLKDLKSKASGCSALPPRERPGSTTPISRGPAAIVIGSEGDGMSRLVAENCDFSGEHPHVGGGSLP